MGNANFYDDSEFMLQFYRKEKDFFKQEPLFDSEQIKFPLSTNCMYIVDSTGRRVKLAGVNWSGGHAERHCVGGLDKQKLSDICKMIRKDLDLNSVRLTFSLQMYYDNNVIDHKLIKANPDLYGKTSMEIFDITIRELTRHGIMVYLNNHTSKSQWCCSNSDGDGLWYSKEYSEEKFEACLRALAHRYKNNPLVIGMDLRNQIRKANGVNPTWGDKNPKSDWHMAAERIGNQIQDIAPHWLIIIGGLFYQIDLTGVKDHPVRLKIPNKLVYTGHLYNFSWPAWVIIKWKVSAYSSFYEKVFNEQLYIRNLGVPYLLGQFGNNEDDVYWGYMMKLLKQTDVDWSYWCLDGYKCKQQEDETYGLLNYEFNKPRYPWMISQLKQVGRPKKKRGGLKIHP